MQYRVTIERLDDAGEFIDTILTLPVGAEQVAEIVPDLLTSALGVEVSAPEPGSSSGEASGSTAGKHPRRRRTKAQIAADEAAAKAAQTAPAETAPAEATRYEPEQPAAPLATGGIIPQPANQTPAFEPPVSAPATGTPTQQAGGYNPFVKS